MKTLVIFNLILISIIVVSLWLTKRFIRSERGEHTLLLAAPIVTILCHYSSFLYCLFFRGGAYEYLSENPNLILPIYPCNVVMWCCLIYGLTKNKESKFGRFLSDYIFWFGIASTLVGMFANVDFIMNPTLRDFEVTKSIVAHATLLFNVLLIPTEHRLRPSFARNMGNITISVIVMYVIGIYCNLVFRVLVSADAAYDVNSMFIIHSPFEAIPFLRYPIIALAALVIYLIIFTVCDLINSEKGERWFNKTIKTTKQIFTHEEK